MLAFAAGYTLPATTGVLAAVLIVNQKVFGTELWPTVTALVGVFAATAVICRALGLGVIVDLDPVALPSAPGGPGCSRPRSECSGLREQLQLWLTSDCPGDRGGQRLLGDRLAEQQPTMTCLPGWAVSRPVSAADARRDMTGVEDNVPVRMADGGVCHS